MTKTFVEIVEELKAYDEVYLLELLNITAEDIVDRFEDVIETRLDYVKKAIQE